MLNHHAKGISEISQSSFTSRPPAHTQAALGGVALVLAVTVVSVVLALVFGLRFGPSAIPRVLERQRKRRGAEGALGPARRGGREVRVKGD
mmetsp:Transcript_37066/g.116622  ORF Transcript_37066/g.116622 Transcript_37066/m.116622 type:complete len:91 (-) Transcript_37066:568-840(-)